jgi:hypothetical protein
MATSPQFISTSVIAQVNISAANTALDGTGTITELVAGVAGGRRILEVVAKAAATSANSQIGLFLSIDSGTTWRLFDQINLTAATVSTTVASARVSRTYSNLVLNGTAHRVGVTTTVAQSVNVIALGGDL